MNVMSRAHTLRIVAVVLLYWSVAISMVFINKFLVGSSTDPYDISLFVAWIQCCITTVLIQVKAFAKSVVAGEGLVCMKAKGTTKRPVVAMSVTFVMLLALNNLCLKHVGVAFFQLARSMTLLFTVLLTVVFLRKSFEPRALLPCGMIAFGFVLGIDQEHLIGELSLEGVVFGVLTSFFVALNGILIKKSLEAVGQDAERLTYYNNLNASVIFVPLVLITGQLTDFLSSARSSSSQFWLYLLLSGLLSLAMGWVSAVQIKLTSPVTHHVSSNTKSLLQTVIAVVHYQLHKTALWWAGVCCVLVGVTYYAVTGVRKTTTTGADTKTDGDKQQDVNHNVQHNSVEKYSNMKLESV